MDLAVSRSERSGAGRRMAWGLLAVLACVAWALAAHSLWRSSVPGGLKLAHVDPRSLFGASYLSSSRS